MLKTTNIQNSDKNHYVYVFRSVSSQTTSGQNMGIFYFTLFYFKLLGGQFNLRRFLSQMKYQHIDTIQVMYFIIEPCIRFIENLHMLGSGQITPPLILFVRSTN